MDTIGHNAMIANSLLKSSISTVFCIIFSQQILNDRLLRTVINRIKSNFRHGFKLEFMTTYYLKFFVKVF